MKKILAALMCIAMLISACAFAEGGSLTVKNIVAFEDGQTLLDLSGLGLRFEACAGENETDGGVKITLEALDQDALSLTIAYVGGQILLNMSGVSDTYSLDPAALMEAAAAEAGIGEMPELGEAINSAELAEIKALAEKAGDMIEEGMARSEQVEVEGKTYEKSAIRLSAGQADAILLEGCAILDKYGELPAESGAESFADLYGQLDLDFDVQGEYYEGEDCDIVDTVITLSAAQAEVAVFSVYAVITQDDAADETAACLELVAAVDGESYGLKMDVELRESDGSWMSAAGVETVDLIKAVDDEAQSQKLVMEALSSAMMGLSYAAAANETVGMLLNSLMSGMM